MTEAMINRYGRVKVRQVVSDFYTRLLQSSTLSHYFDGVSIERLVAHQSAFLEAVMGGPPNHRPDIIRARHVHLGITASDYQETLDLLRESLECHQVASEDVAAVLARYREYAPFVVSQEGGEGRDRDPVPAPSD